jgi:ankyrin repeat protein
MDATLLGIRQWPSMVKFLIEKGADIAIANSGGWTPLNSASESGHLEVFKFLVEKRADITVASNSGWMPLYSASNNGHLEVVKFLIKKGADPKVQGETYCNALQAASYRGRGAILKLLLKTGVDFKAQGKNIHRWTLLHLAARGGHMGTFQFLVSLGLDLFALDAKGDGVLCYASSARSLDILQAALDVGLTFSPEKMHWSPLYWACRSGKLDVMELLVKEGLRAEYVTISEP